MTHPTDRQIAFAASIREKRARDLDQQITYLREDLEFDDPSRIVPQIDRLSAARAALDSIDPIALIETRWMDLRLFSGAVVGEYPKVDSSSEVYHGLLILAKASGHLGAFFAVNP